MFKVCAAYVPITQLRDAPQSHVQLFFTFRSTVVEAAIIGWSQLKALEYLNI